MGNTGKSKQHTMPTTAFDLMAKKVGIADTWLGNGQREATGH
jgi:hypothetical protein